MMLNNIGNSCFWLSSAYHLLSLPVLSTGPGFDASVSLVSRTNNNDITLAKVTFIYPFIAAELVSKAVVCSYSYGNNSMEYEMHAVFELQSRPGTLLQVLTILKVSQ